MSRKRFDTLTKRLSAGELTAAERRELHELCAANEALRAEVRRTEAILAAARESKVEQPSDFEWAAFSTRLKATIDAEQPRPYGRLALWWQRLRAELRPAQVAVAALAAAVAIGTALMVESMFRPDSDGGGDDAVVKSEPELPELEWAWEDIEEHYELAEVLPDVDLLALELELDAEFDEVRSVIENAPSFNGNGEDALDDILDREPDVSRSVTVGEVMQS